MRAFSLTGHPSVDVVGVIRHAFLLFVVIVAALLVVDVVVHGTRVFLLLFRSVCIESMMMITFHLLPFVPLLYQSQSRQPVPPNLEDPNV